MRTFAVSRIRAAVLLSDSFVVPDNFDPQTYRTGRFGLFGSDRDHLVRIRFDRDHAPYLLERQWHPEEEITKETGGAVLLTFPAVNLHTVRQWVLSWGDGATVLEPPALVAMVKTALQKTLAAYGEGNESEEKR